MQGRWSTGAEMGAWSLSSGSTNRSALKLGADSNELGAQPLLNIFFRRSLYIQSGELGSVGARVHSPLLLCVALK